MTSPPLQTSLCEQTFLSLLFSVTVGYVHVYYRWACWLAREGFVLQLMQSVAIWAIDNLRYYTIDLFFISRKKMFCRRYTLRETAYNVNFIYNGQEEKKRKQGEERWSGLCTKWKRRTLSNKRNMRYKNIRSTVNYKSKGERAEKRHHRQYQ